MSRESRPKMWARLSADASNAIGKLREAFGDVENALDELSSMREDYESWKDSLDGRFEGSALVEKLDAIIELDFDSAKSECEQGIDSLESFVSELEGIDLPMGFGRD